MDTAIALGLSQQPDELPALAQGWVLTFDGVGPVRVGMTEAEAAAVLGDALDWPNQPEEGCDYAGIANAGGLLFFLIADGVIGRIDVYTHAIRSADGAGVGDREQWIHQIYRDRVEVKPHPYTDGHYLIVAAPGDSTHRIIFETNADTVTNFRTGVRPVVDWIEGCS